MENNRLPQQIDWSTNFKYRHNYILLIAHLFINASHSCRLKMILLLLEKLKCPHAVQYYSNVELGTTVKFSVKAATRQNYALWRKVSQLGGIISEFRSLQLRWGLVLMVQKTSDLQVWKHKKNYPAMKMAQILVHMKKWNTNDVADVKTEALHWIFRQFKHDSSRLGWFLGEDPRGTDGGRTSGAARRSASGSTRRTLEEENKASARNTTDGSSPGLELTRLLLAPPPHQPDERTDLLSFQNKSWGNCWGWVNDLTQDNKPFKIHG